MLQVKTLEAVIYHSEAESSGTQLCSGCHQLIQHENLVNLKVSLWTIVGYNQTTSK